MIIPDGAGDVGESGHDASVIGDFDAVAYSVMVG